MDMSILYSSKSSIVIEKLKASLPPVYDLATFEDAVKQLKLNDLELEGLEKKLKPFKNSVGIHWNGKAVLDLYTTLESVSTIDLLSGWTHRKCYLSHLSALYFHEIVEQRPVTHYLSMDLHVQKTTVGTVEPLLMKQSFMKQPRTSSKIGSFMKNQFCFTEKPKNTPGIVSVEIIEDDLSYPLRLTNIERTLIDSIVAPQYGGGLLTILAAMKKVSINLEELKSIYDFFQFRYPYWQSIGFLLEVGGQAQHADDWFKLHKMNKIEFFVDHGFRENWLLDKKWMVRYPEGLK